MTCFLTLRVRVILCIVLTFTWSFVSCFNSVAKRQIINLSTKCVCHYSRHLMMTSKSGPCSSTWSKGANLIETNILPTNHHVNSVSLLWNFLKSLSSETKRTSLVLFHYIISRKFLNTETQFQFNSNRVATSSSYFRNSILTKPQSKTLANKNVFNRLKLGIINMVLCLTICLNIAIKPSYARSSNFESSSQQQIVSKTTSRNGNRLSRSKATNLQSSTQSDTDQYVNIISDSTTAASSPSTQSSTSTHSSGHSSHLHGQDSILSSHSARVSISTTKDNNPTNTHSASTSKSTIIPAVKDIKKKKSISTSSNTNTLLDVEENDHEAVVEVKSTFRTLIDSLHGPKLDTLIVLLVSSAVVPLFKRLNVSPIVGFLLAGTMMGPTGLNWVRDIHLMDIIGELGIVFFLFEMGLELSLDRLKSMRRDVFGLGTCQFFLTAAVGTLISLLCGLTPPAAITVGGSLSLSSSAFVLELLKDKKALGTRHGKASFGILLLQDLAVVPLLVVVELLSKGGTGIAKALAVAATKAVVTLTTMNIAGRSLINPIFYFVAKSNSQEAFISIILSTVLLMSFVTKGVGLSDTLGAFLAGLLLSETKFKYQIESDIAPFRGLLLGIFFITVGFSIDISVILKETPLILAMMATLIAGKASIITALSMLFGMPFSSSQKTGLLNAAGGEFAFVAFGIAEKSGLISKPLTKKLLTTVALSMALTPLLDDLGTFISNKLDELKDGNDEKASFTSLKSTVLLPFSQSNNDEIKGATNDDFVLVCGYGRVGKMICDLFDQKMIKYLCVDKRPNKDARNQGLPIYFGDATRPEVLKRLDLTHAKACVVAFNDDASTNKVVESIRMCSKTVPIIVRTTTEIHRRKLEKDYSDVTAYSPILPADSVLLSLPFGGVVLQKIGMSKSEINSVLEEYRDMYMKDTSLDEDTFDFLDAVTQRLPPSVTTSAADVVADVSNSSTRSGSNADNHVDIEPYLFETVDSSDVYNNSSSSSRDNSVAADPTTEFDV